MEAEDIDEPDGVGGGPQVPTGEEDDHRHGEGRGVSEEEEVVTLDSQRIFLLMRKEYRSGDNSDSDEVMLTLLDFVAFGVCHQNWQILEIVS